MSVAIAFLVIIIWSIYRLIFPENLLLEELFLKPFVWLTPVFLITRGRNLGFNRKNILKNISIGLAIGLLLSIERVIVNHPQFSFSFDYTITAFFTAATEEIFFRGYLLSRWLKYISRPFWPLLLNGLFFTTAHIPMALFIYHYQGYSLFVFLLTNFISGMVDVLLFYQTKSVVAPIANHFIWNVFSGLFR